MAGLLPPVIATFIADGKQYTAEVDKMMAKNEEFNTSSQTMGQKFTKAGGMLSTAVIGAGVAFAAYGVDKAVKFEDALEQLGYQTDITQKQLGQVKNQAFALSNATGQSTSDIIAAYEAAEQAGYKFGRATSTVAAATKLATISGNTTTEATQALIGAQNLGLTTGMSSAKVADILTIALKGNEQGLNGVVNLLQGKVGSAFAAYHQSVGEAVGVANEFSLAGITQTRQIATFVNKLGALNGPLNDTVITNGKLTTSTAGYVNSLREVGLSVDKTKDAFSGPDGLVNGLKYLKAEADGSLPKLQQYLTAIFGSTQVGAGMALVDHLSDLTRTINGTGNASSSGLNKSFNSAAQTFGVQMHIIEQNLVNAAAQFGLVLLPYIRDAATFIENGMTSLEKHPGQRLALEVSLGTAFVAAIGVKIASALQTTVQTSLLKDIAENTSKTALATEGEDAEGGGAGFVGKGSLVVGAGIAAFYGTTEALRHNLFGLGTAVNDVAGIFGDLDGALTHGTTRLAGKTKSDLNYGAAGLSQAFASGNDRQGLTEAVVAYLQNKAKGGNGKVTLKASVKSR